MIIDWHNLGYSILALKLGDKHPLVRIAKQFEAYFGRSAYAHLFVTRAMCNFLVKEWKLEGHKLILHDRPPARFHRASPSEMHELFLRLQPALALPTLTSFLPPCVPPYSTPFTTMPQSSDTTAMGAGASLPMPREDRPALLVSSTSWTPDEDFSILLDALVRYEERARECRRLPKVLAVVTGKGPLRDKYMREIGRMQSGEGGGEPWQYVRCMSMWLEAEDYPILLGSADLGISLHSSSSALDLPMKVVDMFGCGLPVCALGFACLDELVKDGTNGLVFHNAEQLAAQLESLLSSHPNSAQLETLRVSLQHSTPMSPSTHTSSAFAEGPQEEEDEESWRWCTWAQNWDRIMRPLLLKDVGGDDL